MEVEVEGHTARHVAGHVASATARGPAAVSGEAGAAHDRSHGSSGGTFTGQARSERDTGGDGRGNFSQGGAASIDGDRSERLASKRPSTGRGDNLGGEAMQSERMSLEDANGDVSRERRLRRRARRGGGEGRRRTPCPPTWNLAMSIFAPRGSWCDSKALLDTDEVEKQRVSNDVWRYAGSHRVGGPHACPPSHRACAPVPSARPPPAQARAHRPSAPPPRVRRGTQSCHAIRLMALPHVSTLKQAVVVVAR